MSPQYYQKSWFRTSQKIFVFLHFRFKVFWYLFGVFWVLFFIKIVNRNPQLFCQFFIKFSIIKTRIMFQNYVDRNFLLFVAKNGDCKVVQCFIFPMVYNKVTLTKENYKNVSLKINDNGPWHRKLLDGIDSRNFQALGDWLGEVCKTFCAKHVQNWLEGVGNRRTVGKFHFWKRFFLNFLNVNLLKDLREVVNKNK